MGRLIFSVWIAAASAAVFCAALAIRLATPAVAEFLASEAPRMYGSVASWLTPPYLYFVINGIIIAIATTSLYQKTVVATGPPPWPEEADFTAPAEYVSNVTEDADLRTKLFDPAVEITNLSLDAVEQDKEFLISRSSWSASMGASEVLREKSAGNSLVGYKPLVSARVGRRSTKVNLEGKALGVARRRKKMTLESTWRTITDGRSVPLARHLKKADTARATAIDSLLPPPPPVTVIQKSETFAAPPSAAFDSSPAAKLRRETSLGQDDLNRRVEAFIKKFNKDMRLQRQDSLQKYNDMINRGSN